MMNLSMRGGRPPRPAIGAGIAALLAAGWLMAPASVTAAGFASVEPEAGSSGVSGTPSTPAASQLLPDAAAPWTRAAGATPHQRAVKTPPHLRATAGAASGSTMPSGAAPSSAGGEAAPSGINIVSWSLGPHLGAGGAIAPGRSLYLRMTIAGGAAAVARMRDAGPVVIEVHWTHGGAGANRGSPDLTTRLTVGRPSLARAFAGEVARQGHFQWHSWARKDALSPGQWSVSLTYPDGRPVMCGEAAPQPCRLSFTVG